MQELRADKPLRVPGPAALVPFNDQDQAMGISGGVHKQDSESQIFSPTPVMCLVTSVHKPLILAQIVQRMMLKPRAPPAKHSPWQRKGTEGLHFFIATQKPGSSKRPARVGSHRRRVPSTAEHAAQSCFRLRSLQWFSLPVYKTGRHCKPFFHFTNRSDSK